MMSLINTSADWAKQPERFQKSHGHPKSINKLTPMEPAMTIYKSKSLIGKLTDTA